MILNKTKKNILVAWNDDKMLNYLSVHVKFITLPAIHFVLSIMINNNDAQVYRFFHFL